MKGGIRGLCASKQDTRTLQSDLTYFITPSISWNTKLKCHSIPYSNPDYFRQFLSSLSSHLSVADYRPDLWSSLLAILNELKAKGYWPDAWDIKHFRRGEIWEKYSQHCLIQCKLSWLFPCFSGLTAFTPHIQRRQGSLGREALAFRRGWTEPMWEVEKCMTKYVDLTLRDSAAKKKNKKSGLKDRPTHFTWKKSVY